MSANSSDPTQIERWRQRYTALRAHTEVLAAPLSAEDQAIQSMPDASPTKWHQAHTSWFFETLLLAPLLPGYRLFDPAYRYLFNSYYEALGPRHPRPQRGLLSRPGLAEVQAYRAHVDAAMGQLLERIESAALPLLELGLQHEQQHQELMLTDILHAFSCNPLLPAYREETPPRHAPHALEWLSHPGGQVEVGAGEDGFAFDNERPRHAALLAPFRIADRLVTCGEFADFIADGGYRQPSLWLSDGWALALAQGWQQPAYWLAPGDARAPASEQWQVFGLHGLRPLDPHAPVQQLSFYEAAAYAEWAGARLPTEFEWEAACGLPGIAQLFDQAWQWTRSAYHPYPGFRPLAGAVGEYNGKFMVGQLVLRGGSLATPAGHARPSYRNFFPPAARWQFSGLRLARDGESSS
ncbi:ergothioneine biosynthesis protein EgtB [Roseateles violae]|uniref:Ergothioneine biosynthesis protein EgtB n=1 Tax=Roseateles violae TaxID=3058042 RepID=A0ABT8DWP4_9BURK|nr:ergothioneine biosynthesis protein EgtB [Pelomonas sp. PFR6]MDN3920774.1 ergothioneine biosynthesis protein EgtB [Pelomonas sp. PFR6]